MTIDYSKLPDHMQGSARRYIEQGIHPGSFLAAVICNDLFDAFARADEINQAAMLDWVRFFYNDAPNGCWGSPQHLHEWCAIGGLWGIDAADEEMDG